MPKVVKYSTTTPSGSLRKGNMAIGPGAFDYGSTFYTTVEPPSGGYVIYQYKASGGPSIYVASNDASLISFTKHISGTTYGSAAACLDYFSTQTDKIVIASSDDIPVSVTNGLVLNLNAGMASSYPKTGTTWYDVSGGSNNGTLTNGLTFNANGAIVFDGADDYVPFYAPNLGTIATIEMLCKIGDGYSGKMFCGWNTSYDVWCNGGTIGYNTGGGDVYGISQSTVNSLGVINRWAHYIFEFRSDVSYTNNKIYINGILQTLSQQYGGEGGKSFAGGNGFIATWGYGGYYMPMDCAVFKVYNRALTQAEVNQNYFQAPIVTGSLTHLWDAGNLKSYPRTGTTTYNMTSSTNGTLQNGVSYNSGNGGYWSFDGVDDRILLDNSNYSFSLGDGNSNWTVNAWVKTTTAANGLGAGSVLSNSNGGPVYSMMGINGGKIVYWVYPSNINSWKGWQGTITVNNGAWHMLTWVNKVGYTMDMYVDGVLDTTISPTNAGNNNPIDIIGGSWAANFQGDISTVQVYQGKAFTASEVNQNFNTQRNRFGL